MTIRHTLTRKDLMVVNLHLLIRKKFAWVLWASLTAFIAFTDVRTPEIASHGVGNQALAVVIIAVVVLLWIFGFAFSVACLRILLRKNVGVLGEHQVQLRDDGLIEATDHNESLYRWSAYSGTISTRGYLILRPTESAFHPISKTRALIMGDLNAFETELAERTSSQK